ncbi:MAG TPA: tetratricopeptide repeat protein [Burkholderiales bacterium]|nr:tetratricopeptide repeat protein [Betaproteobacteria bacterium]HQR52223.1 tetratricopeptide repeat protein [Burkholderiales bacterium]
MAIYDLEEQEKLDALKGWWSDNGRTVILAVVACVAVVLAVQGWRYHERTQALEAAALYGQLLEAVQAKDVKKANDVAAELFKAHGKSGYAAMGALGAARASVDAGNLAAAKANLTWAAEHAPDAATRDIARVRLAAVLLDEKRYEEALRELDAKHADATAPLFAELKGDVLAAQGKVAEARAAYQTVLIKLPLGSSGRDLVELKLDGLGEAR